MIFIILVSSRKHMFIPLSWVFQETLSSYCLKAVKNLRFLNHSPRFRLIYAENQLDTETVGSGQVWAVSQSPFVYCDLVNIKEDFHPQYLQGVPKKIGILSSFEFLGLGGVFLGVKNNSKNFGNKENIFLAKFWVNGPFF